MAAFDLSGVTRLLLKTDTWKNVQPFPREFSCLKPEVARFLSETGVRLIGIDTPSVDPPDSEDLLAHHALFAHGIHILESLLLTHVEPGDYELIALPLPLADADASPVRAVLRPLARG